MTFAELRVGDRFRLDTGRSSLAVFEKLGPTAEGFDALRLRLENGRLVPIPGLLTYVAPTEPVVRINEHDDSVAT